MKSDQIKRGRCTHSVPPGTAGQLAHDKAKCSTPSQTPSLATLLSHAGVVSSESNAPMAPSLCLATTYIRPPDGPYHDSDYIYTRMDNPTRTLLENTVGRLECHGDERNVPQIVSCAFSSGMATVSSIVMSHQSPVTVLLPSDLYMGVPTVLLANHWSRFDVNYKTVDFSNESNVENALSSEEGKDVIVWLETPSNPQCRIIDIEGTCAIVNKFRPFTDITTVVDSTLAPPCVTQPLRVSESLIIIALCLLVPRTDSLYYLVGCRCGYAFRNQVARWAFGRTTWYSNSIAVDRTRSSVRTYLTWSADRDGSGCFAI